MVEARKCARCGCMYIAQTQVCGACLSKDGAEMQRLKGFIENQGTEGLTQNELTIATGITNKNLTRFLGYETFKDVSIAEKTIAATGEVENQEGITQLI